MGKGNPRILEVSLQHSGSIFYISMSCCLFWLEFLCHGNGGWSW